ncbi:MAG: hypothetical protein KA270_00940 [Saprospiraceae bacterium]|nr:hypothetical protein [Saprospiraceae bacterium]MBP6565695.1 hypothetical protein [Saprospiraceae bacterium]
MSFLLDQCTLRVYDAERVADSQPFDCANADLNDFFANDLVDYSDQLLGKSYCFTLDEDPSIILCAFTISNDSIKTLYLPNNRKKKVIQNIPRQKQMRSYPAVLIGRLGVHKDFRNIEGEEQRTGDQLMDFIKSWFVDGHNKTGCRFIVVDAYNEVRVIRYYGNNGFNMLFNTEDQEKEYYQMDGEATLSTRLMYFDLIVLRG